MAAKTFRQALALRVKRHERLLVLMCFEGGISVKVHNWEKWQSYRRDRGQPPWIKVHRQLMRDVKWVSLTDGQRGQLVSLWLLAADNDGEIPTASIAKKLCYMNSEPDYKLLIKLGFIEDDANMTPQRRQDDANMTQQSREEEIREETEERRGDTAPRRSTPTTDDEFWASLKSNPAYSGIDLVAERGKMVAWLALPKNSSRRLTRQFVLNWLNKIEKPMEKPNDGKSDTYRARTRGLDEWAAAHGVKDVHDGDESIFGGVPQLSDGQGKN